MKKLQALGGKLLLLLLSLVLTLGAVEVLVRIVRPCPRYEYINVPDDRVGHVVQRGFRGRATNMFGEFDTRLDINKEGFRDTDHPLEKSPGVYRIAFLGDSFTFAEQVEEPDCFVRLTETLLNRSMPQRQPPGPKIECMNFGMGGYEIYQYLLCYEAFVRKYKPDMVVTVIYTDNDLLGNAFYLLDSNAGRPHFRLKNGQPEKVSANPELLEANYQKFKKRLKVHWYQHLHCYNLHKLVFWEIRQKQRLARARKQKLPLTELWKESGYRSYRYYATGINDPIVAEADTLSRLLLQKLQQEVEADGAKFRVVMLPCANSLFPEKWPERLHYLPGLENVPMDFNRPFDQIRAFLPSLAANGGLLDTRPALRDAAKKAPVFYPRDSHFNKNGQAAVGQAIAEWLFLGL
ncbi:MAG: SGNH/GDSL hydrolase family protein [Verrucomicrobiae bacterium]|nr:SGNH/GDSL hydrolase family protein [Verrucomicrobiae bacterium]